MPRTPDRSPGALEEDEEIRLGANAVPPTVPGAVSFDGTAFQLRDAAGIFDPRASGGFDPNVHRQLDQLVHALDETHEQVPVITADGLITSVVAQVVGGGTSIRDYDQITVDADGLITGARVQQRNGSGAVVETLTAAVTVVAGLPTKSTVTRT